MGNEGNRIVGTTRAMQVQVGQLWEQIGISNDFLFGKLMRSRPGLCRKLLQRVLPELDIARIELIETQKTIREDQDARGVRLDVYVRDEADRVYSIEMQMADTKELPRRSRYYQGMIDLQLLERGELYRSLNDTYVIFICPFDLYGTGRHRYTFAGACQEDPRVLISDGAVRIFLNARGTMNDVSSSLKAFLDYVAGIMTEDPFVQELDEAVIEARKNREWRHEYMTLYLRDQENLEKGRAEGKAEGLAEGLKRMIAALKKYGVPDEEIRKTVQEDYGLTEEELNQYLD